MSLRALTGAEYIKLLAALPPRSDQQFLSQVCVLYYDPVLAIDFTGSVGLLLLLSQEECDRWHAQACVTYLPQNSAEIRHHRATPHQGTCIACATHELLG
jgi:hypothetical protein